MKTWNEGKKLDLCGVVITSKMRRNSSEWVYMCTMCRSYRYRVMMWERDLRHFDIYKVDDDDLYMKLQVVKYRKVYYPKQPSTPVNCYD